MRRKYIVYINILYISFFLISLNKLMFILLGQLNRAHSFDGVSFLITQALFFLRFCLRKIVVKELWGGMPTVQQHSIGRGNVTKASSARHG